MNTNMNTKRAHGLVTAAGAALLTAALATPAQAIDLRSWDKKYNLASERFQVLAAFNNEAVLDKETQLVWERSPAGNTGAWDQARYSCLHRFYGGRKGWRLPSVHELASLVAPSSGIGAPAFPAGHPFTNVVLSSDGYWSVTGHEAGDQFAYYIRFNDGEVLVGTKSSLGKRGWCVRGGSASADRY